MGCGHVFRPYRRAGWHNEIVRLRLEALLRAGITMANMAVAADNTASLLTALKAGFAPFALGPDRSPTGTRAPHVFLHWTADQCPWVSEI